MVCMNDGVFNGMSSQELDLECERHRLKFSANYVFDSIATSFSSSDSKRTAFAQVCSNFPTGHDFIDMKIGVGSKQICDDFVF